MAKKRKRIHHRTHHRRRVGAIPGGFDIEGLALAAAGAVAARVISTHLANNATSTTPSVLAKAAPYAGVILGIVLPMVSKNEMVKDLSFGLFAGGAISALGPSGMNVISGLEDSVAGIGYPPNYVSAIPYRAVAGLDQGLAKGTRSNFSGSRQSQINTIAGIHDSN